MALAMLNMQKQIIIYSLQTLNVFLFNLSDFDLSSTS